MLFQVPMQCVEASLRVTGVTSKFRTVKHPLPGQPQGQKLLCVTVHIHLSAKALGQFLALPAHDRPGIGAAISQNLHDDLVSTGIEYEYVTIQVQHDAQLAPQDYRALRDLLWQFPTSEPYCALIMDAHWWVSSYAVPVKHPLPWCCFQPLDWRSNPKQEEVELNILPCLDSTCDFLD